MVYGIIHGIHAQLNNTTPFHLRSFVKSYDQILFIK